MPIMMDGSGNEVECDWDMIADIAKGIRYYGLDGTEAVRAMAQHMLEEREKLGGFE